MGSPSTCQRHPGLLLDDGTKFSGVGRVGAGPDLLERRSHATEHDTVQLGYKTSSPRAKTVFFFFVHDQHDVAWFSPAQLQCVMHLISRWTPPLARSRAVPVCANLTLTHHKASRFSLSLLVIVVRATVLCSQPTSTPLTGSLQATCHLCIQRTHNRRLQLLICVVFPTKAGQATTCHTWDVEARVDRPETTWEGPGTTNAFEADAIMATTKPRVARAPCMVVTAFL